MIRDTTKTDENTLLIKPVSGWVLQGKKLKILTKKLKFFRKNICRTLMFFEKPMFEFKRVEILKRN